MIRINILTRDGADSVGYLDFDGRSSLSFKRPNTQFNWAVMSVGRSTQFTVPATDYNRLLLGFSEDPSEYGAEMRMRHVAQLQYSGGAREGRLDVTGYDGRRFSCVFYYDCNADIEALNGRKLSDCKTDIKSVTWSKTYAVNANDPNVNTMPLAIVKYGGTYNDLAASANWSWLPSLSLKLYLEDILDGMGISHSLAIPARYRIISATLNGSDTVSGVVAKSSMTSGTIAAALGHFLEWDTDAELYEAGGFFTSTHTPSWALRPKVDIELTFPLDFPAGCELIHVDGRKVTFVGDHYYDIDGWHGEGYAGRTIQLAAGQSFFIVRDSMTAYGNSHITGWTSDESPWSYSFNVARSGDISLGDAWNPAYNAPDMTVVELLRTAALLTGRELYYDIDTQRVVIAAADIGSTMRDSMDGVKEVLSVTRGVADWGSGTVREVVRFDSEEYVRQPLLSVYQIDNTMLDGEAENVLKVSEGNPSQDGDGTVYVEDVEFDGVNGKLKARKWTIGLCGDSNLMMRASLSPYDANATIARCSTCLKVRRLMDVDAFLSMPKDTLFDWRGVWYVWTSAEWSEGVATLTLQKY